MASKVTIAELLVEIGVDAKDAEKAADRIKDKLKKVGKAGEEADKGVTKGEKALKRFAKAGEVANKVANGLAVVITGAAGAVAAIGKQVLTTGARFEKLRAQLKTTTGSAEGAQKALDFIKDFAKNTPFQVDQITDAFIKLNNFGIEPTERTMTAFGDFASAMGKDLDQFVEAVLDATTGEFERLKEFGIKTKSEGDRVAFTFKGITTTVGKNSKEIEQFLTGLAEQNFGGAMAEQMQTAGGLISNLQDTWQEFLNTVAQLGPLDEFKALVADLQKAVGNKQGGLAKLLADVLVKAIKTVRRLIAGDFNKTLERIVKVLGFVVDNFGLLVSLFAGAKFASATASVVGGLQSMGVAATGALGPIGAIIAALGVLIPLALEAGNALGDVLAKQQGLARTTVRSAPKTSGVTSGAGKIAARSQAFASRALLEAERKAETLRGEGASDFDIELAELDVSKKQASLKKAQRAVASARKQEAAAAEQAARGEATKARRTSQKEQNQRFRDVKDLLRSGSESGATLSQDLAAARKAIAGGATVEEALTAVGEAGVAREEERGFGIIGKREGADAENRRNRKAREKADKEKKKRVTSPTTVSEFFSAAARGDLGKIADRTPSTRDIEPTVAVDITNNNIKFDAKFNITGKGDAGSIGRSVATEIKAELGRMFSNAGNQIPNNGVR